MGNLWPQILQPGSDPALIVSGVHECPGLLHWQSLAFIPSWLVRFVFWLEARGHDMTQPKQTHGTYTDNI